MPPNIVGMSGTWQNYVSLAAFGLEKEIADVSLRFLVSWRALLVIGVAIVMAFISAKFLFNGSILNIVPWGILAVATAFVAASRRQSLILGAIFGFVVSYAFLWFDNSGTKTLSSVLILIPLIVLPAAFGALCGLALAWAGWMLRHLLSRPHLS